MTTKDEALKLALEALDCICSPLHVREINKIGVAMTAIRETLAEQPAQHEQGDSICQENDGCPTEKAVLQRFWRGQPIPTEHYPAWFKPAQQQEPVAWMYPSDYKKCLTSEHVAEVTSIECTSLRTGEKTTIPLYTSPSASKPWVGLTDHEVDECYYWKDRQWTTDELVRHVEAKLREKNA